jgi:CubicO group peptidase (beta-lactamase class C family)
MVSRRRALGLGVAGLLGGQGLVSEAFAQRKKKAQEPPRPGAARGRGGAGGLEPFDGIVAEICEQHQIAGATLAIAKAGRLVMARGFGLADVPQNQAVTPGILFSLGSVTKSVSAVAALALVDQGKLDLEAKLVDVLADLKPMSGQRIADPRFRLITVHHLLYHAGGFGRAGQGPSSKKKAFGEPSEDDSDLESTQEIEHAYRVALGRPLEFGPGSEHRYSNFGFLFVRLVIERAAGQPYEPFVREQILKPMGITRMVMERDDSIPDETRRYALGPNGLKPVKHLTHNWLATPTDMTRFLIALTGSRGRSFLSPRTFKQMLSPPPPPIESPQNGRYVGLGWDSVRRSPEGYRFSKNGGKAGVRAWLEHMPNGIDWCFMFNTTEPAGAAEENAPDALREASRRIAQAALQREQWPRVDLFAAGG